VCLFFLVAAALAQLRWLFAVLAARLPEFTKRPESATVPEGHDAKFEVIVDGEPRPEVKW
jgi:hypothetical protein